MLEGAELLCHGRLLKRDRTFPAWKWREFYLYKRRVQFFNERGTFKGEILLSPTIPIVIKCVEEPKPYGFVLLIREEKLLLSASSDAERQKWLDALADNFAVTIERPPPVLEKPKRQNRHPTENGNVLNILTTNSSSTSGGTNNNSHNTTNPGIGAAATVSSNSASTASSITSSSPVIAEAPSAAAASSASSCATVVTAAAAAASSSSSSSCPASKMTFGALQEPSSLITFPPKLSNGDLLAGVGPIVRRMGWTDERILSVGMYIDANAAKTELNQLKGQTLRQLYGDQLFYDTLIESNFRRTFVISSRKRIAKSVLCAVLHDELAPRIVSDAIALREFLGFIEKSLRKAAAMVLTCNPNGTLEFRFRGISYPPISSVELCLSILSFFFDVNSIQHDAKRGLIERIPSLWGDSERKDKPIIKKPSKNGSGGGGGHDLMTVDAAALQLNMKQNKLVTSDDDGDDDDDDDDDELEDDEEDDDDDDDDDDDHDEEDGNVKADIQEQVKRQIQIRDEEAEFDLEDEQDDREHELLRRQSLSVVVHFGPLIDPDSHTLFAGHLEDGSALLGTWSTSLTGPCRFTVGLYVDPAGATVSLLKYKGLSVGSILQDPEFFNLFTRSAFVKHLVLSVTDKVSWQTLEQYLLSHLHRNRTVSEHAVSLEDMQREFAFPQEMKNQTLTPESAMVFTFRLDGTMQLQLTKQNLKGSGPSKCSPSAHGEGSKTLVNEHSGSETGSPSLSARSSIAGSLPNGSPSVEELTFDHTFTGTFQGLFYGFNAMDAHLRSSLMQRLPSLLDVAKDDLVHTYHDEIEVLKENYKRQPPENRIKAGYLLLSMEKRSTIYGGKPSSTRWACRWCRLDGLLFSYYSHKRKRRPREVIDLSECHVSDMSDVPQFMERKENVLTSAATAAASAVMNTSTHHHNRPCIKIAIKRANGQVFALKTESIYEGAEWLEALREASLVRLNDDVSPDEDEEVIDEAEVGMAHDQTIQKHQVAAENTPSDETATTLEAPAGVSTSLLSSMTSSMVVPVGDADGEKVGSLVRWMIEDIRHALIMLLMLLIVWVLSVKEMPVHV